MASVRASLIPRYYVQMLRKSLLAATVLAGTVIAPAISMAQTWTALKNQPPVTNGAGESLLLTNGTVMTQDVLTGNWFVLTPDSTGSYINGKWSKAAAMPSGYGPLYNASQVLPNGNVIIQGGEYNLSGGGVWTTKGALYDTAKNTWSSVSPPSGWSTIGDAQSVLLGNGTYQLANCCTTQEVTLDFTGMTYTTTGTGKNDINDEEGWTLLPTGQVLTVDCNDTADNKHTEIETSGAWASAGDTPVELDDLGTKTNSHEMGPLVLLPNGTVLAVGATGYTAIYTISSGTWTQGPTFPKSGNNYYDEADGPGALLPDGNVLLAASPGVYNSPTQFFEYSYAGGGVGTLTEVPNTPNASGEPSYAVNLLVLPTGQVFQTDQSGDVEIYTPSGTANPAWAPVISSFPTKVKPKKTYTLTGTLLSGMSQAGFYGDDNQQATNYPIVEVVNTASGAVQFATTTNPSSYLPANPNSVTVSVTMPKGLQKGASNLYVVTNGIASKAFPITVK